MTALRRLAGLFFLCLLSMLAAPARAAASMPVAAEGRLQTPPGLRAPLSLQGQWGFAWQQFVDPGWQQLPTQAFAPVPGSWNALTAGGKPPGENGWGSYVLQVDCPAGQSLALEAVGQRTASRLFVNGVEVAAHGSPGPQASNHAAVHDRVPITREFACPLRLTLHVANFDHRAGGFVRPLAVGPLEVLQRQREARVVVHAALLTAYLLTAAVALIFFVLRPRERVTLVYGLFCIAIAVYADMIGERLLLRPLARQVDWASYMRIEYLSWLVAMALFLLTLRGLFPGEIQRRVVQGVLGALALAGAAVLALPPGVYSHLAVPGQAVAVVVSVYIAAAMLRARGRPRLDGQVLLAGLAAVVGALAIDLLLIDAPGRPDQKFAPFGFALFLLSPAVVIARRMTHALNAEERSRALEENARLREDVERMSRHDLKTPLNSILGAARLLQDDTRLARDQQELVGVLQRAGLRMLEMVNLSLGLFRMETGSYEFRPQAVDLRAVVSRVLVDLHSYAEANQVELNWRGSGDAPTHVRGEELLCYSIVANLVKNAIEAAGAGTQVTIAVQPGDPVALTVHNPGEVPPAVAHRFFEKYATSQKSGGTGLGTYSARMMARTQQGDLHMRSGAQGTTLTLTLRAMHDAAPRRHPPAAALDTQVEWLALLPPRDVLLVDDDEFTRLVTGRLLPCPPLRVATAANGQAAIEAMGQCWPHYLLVDMEMPLRNGVETVHWVREREAALGLPRCGVVMMSGNDDADSAARALAAGADRFLVKPVSRERLLGALRELEEGRDASARTPAQPAAAETAASPAGAASPVIASSGDDHRVTVDREWQEMFPEFLKLQRDTVEEMAGALAGGDRQALRFLAHRAYGALASIGMAWAAAQSRVLEHEALHAELAELEPRILALREHLAKLRVDYA